MTTPSRQQLREWSAALTLGPLDPADPEEKRYVPLAEAGRAAVDELLATSPACPPRCRGTAWRSRRWARRSRSS